MASSKFDELTRALASSTSRRQTLKAILGGALGGVLGLGSLGAALAAGCVPHGGACHSNNDCCSHNCHHGTCSCKPTGVVCSNDRECCHGQCLMGLVRVCN